MSSTITLTKEQTSAASNKRSILSLNNNPPANGTESSNKKAKMVQLSSSSFTINPITTSANTDKGTSSEKQPQAQPQAQPQTQTQQSSMQPPQTQTQSRVSKQTQQQQQQQIVNQTDTTATFSSESTTESQQTLSNPTSPLRSQPRNRNPTPTAVSSNAAPTLTSMNSSTQTAVVPQHASVVQHPQMTQVIQATVPSSVTHQVVTQDQQQQQQQPVVADQSTTVPSSTVIYTTPTPFTNNPPTLDSSFMELKEMIISNTDSINYMTNFFEGIQNLIDLDAQRLLVFDNSMNKEIENAIKKGLPFHNTKQFAVIAKSISASNQMNHSSMSQQLKEIQKKQELVVDSFVRLFSCIVPFKKQIEQLTLQVQQYQHIINQHQHQYVLAAPQQQQQQHQYVLAVPQQTSSSLPQQTTFDNNSNNNNNNNSLNLEFNNVMDNIDFDFQHEFN
jgi:hypothetical protein